MELARWVSELKRRRVFRALVGYAIAAFAILQVIEPVMPLQQFLDKHLARARVVQQPGLVVNYFNTQIAMVEAGEGVAIIPSFGVPACRERRIVMSQLVNPVVHLDFHQIRRRARKLPPVAEDFTAYLQSYLARWAVPPRPFR